VLLLYSHGSATAVMNNQSIRRCSEAGKAEETFSGTGQGIESMMLTGSGIKLHFSSRKVKVHQEVGHIEEGGARRNLFLSCDDFVRLVSKV